MSWFSSLFAGQNPTLNSAINNAGAIGGFATGAGESALTPALTWMRNILSGDPSKIAQSLAPEISAQQGQISQAAKQGAEFGTRSGGTASANANAQARGRGDIINLVGGLQSGTAGNLANVGSSLVNTGLSANQQQADLSEMRSKNWADSIFGGAITGGLGIGLGAASKAAGLGAGLGF